MGIRISRVSVLCLMAFSFTLLFYISAKAGGPAKKICMTNSLSSPLYPDCKPFSSACDIGHSSMRIRIYIVTNELKRIIGPEIAVGETKCWDSKGYTELNYVKCGYEATPSWGDGSQKYWSVRGPYKRSVPAASNLECYTTGVRYK